MRKNARIALYVITLLVMCLVPQLLAAQSAPAPGAVTTGQTITGCLQKGLEPGGFFLFTGKDKHWELYENDKVKLADHVGQTVAVTGIVPSRTPTQEDKSQPYEKKESAGKPHSDFQVTAVKVVSPTCSK